MEQFLPIIIIIIIGIMRALSGGKENEKQQKTTQPRPRPRPTATPSGGQVKAEKTVHRSTKSTVDPSNLYEEEQKQQMEQLKSRLNASSNITIDDIGEQDLSIGPAIQDAIRHQSSTRSNEKKEAFKKDVKTGLNHKGLVQGIIMSEVLGPPRARKPYQSVVQDRKRKIGY